MISEIKKKRLIEKKKKIGNLTEKLSILYDELKTLNDEKSKLIMLANTTNFTWFQQYITQRKKYREYQETAALNQAKLSTLEEDIVFTNNKISSLKSKLDTSKKDVEIIKVSTTPEELNLKNFSEMCNFFKTSKHNIVLEKKDKLARHVSPIAKDISDFCFIHKTNEIPENKEIKLRSMLDLLVKTDVLIGESLVSLNIPEWKCTLHGTINSINDKESKYAILIPFKELDKSRLISAIPNNTFFDSSIKIPNNSYILVPKTEFEKSKNKIDNNLKDFEDLNIIAYENNSKDLKKNLSLNQAISLLMHNLSYYEQELSTNGWNNKEALNIFKKSTEHILDKECQIDLKNIVENSIKLPVDLNRYLPYSYTEYLKENSKLKQIASFAKSIEYLYKSIKDFDVVEKKLKTKTTVEYNTEILKSNPKNKTTIKVEDVFSPFIEVLKTRDKNKIDEFLSQIDSKYIQDKEELRNELLKSTSRLKNEEPIRNAFFTNIFERFLHLELKEMAHKEVDKDKDKDIINNSKKTNKSDETIKKSKIKHSNNNHLNNLSKIKTKNDEIIIEPKKDVL